MAGRGPAPTPKAQRRRRNTAKDTPAAAKPKAPAKRRAAAKSDASARSPRDASTRSSRDASTDVERDASNVDVRDASSSSAARPPLELPATYRQRTYDNTLQAHVETTIEFLPETREWYEAYASAPIARELTLVHWRALRRAAVLVDRFERGDHGQADAIRKIETNFGGSPYDQRRMGLDPGELPDPDAVAPPAATAAGGATVTDIRSRLTAPAKTKTAKKR